MRTLSAMPSRKGNPLLNTDFYEADFIALAWLCEMAWAEQLRADASYFRADAVDR